jgi:hypothetical protein
MTVLLALCLLTLSGCFAKRQVVVPVAMASPPIPLAMTEPVEKPRVMRGIWGEAPDLAVRALKKLDACNERLLEIRALEAERSR